MERRVYFFFEKKGSIEEECFRHWKASSVAQGPVKRIGSTKFKKRVVCVSVPETAAGV